MCLQPSLVFSPNFEASGEVGRASVTKLIRSVTGPTFESSARHHLREPARNIRRHNPAFEVYFPTGCRLDRNKLAQFSQE